MRFEYDPAKSAANKAKHGIDFEEAQALWRDGRAISEPAAALLEPRFLITGRIGGKLWTAVVTYRQQSVRIISVRRARAHEAEAYQRGGV
jgi:hypothetical protein